MKVTKRLNRVLSNKNIWLANKNNVAELLAPIILRREHIRYQSLLQVIPASTNAVCRTENYIIKIYAPEVCGCNPLFDLEREVYALKVLGSTAIRVPQLIAYGLFEYDYYFYYLIIEYIHISPVSQFLLSCSRKDMIRLGNQLRKTLRIFKTLHIDRPELSKSTKLYKDGNFVHGDLTSDNVLYDGRSFAIIDFEDWQFAPQYTELPAIIFEMIHEHIDIAPLFLNMSFKELKDKVYAGINAHCERSRFIERYADLFR
jgi:aminoglycoside phosphotransferase (APT) family kinase protein